MTYYLGGDYTTAISDLKKSEKISAAGEDLSIVANAQCAIGWAYYRLGKKQYAERKLMAVVKVDIS